MQWLEIQPGQVYRYSFPVHCEYGYTSRQDGEILVLLRRYPKLYCYMIGCGCGHLTITSQVDLSYRLHEKEMTIEELMSHKEEKVRQLGKRLLKQQQKRERKHAQAV